MEAAVARDRLSEALLDDDCLNALWALVDSGVAAQIIPELPALALEQDPIHKHKDVLAHTIAVTAKTRADLVLRLAALFHDIGKPLTRKIDDDGVTFRHHEAVGAKMAKKRLRQLEYPDDVVSDGRRTGPALRTFQGVCVRLERFGCAALRPRCRSSAWPFE